MYLDIYSTFHNQATFQEILNFLHLHQYWGLCPTPYFNLEFGEHDRIIKSIKTTLSNEPYCESVLQNTP